MTCTFVNTKKPKLTVVKALVPASDSGKFNLLINGDTHATDVGDTGTTGAQYGTIGSNSFGETAGTATSLADYVKTISGTGCSDNGDGTGAITLAAGDDKTCTITNTRKGKIVVVKDANPDDPTDFKFEAGGGLTPALFFLDDDADGTLPNTQTFSGLAPGSTYSVAESVPDGWVQTSATCSDGSPISAIDVSAGETVTCTFVNTKKPKLTVVKVLVPASDSGKFNLKINGTTYAGDVGNGGTTGPQSATIGSNSFGETAGTATSLADYVKTISGAGCSDNGDGTGAITLAAGDDKTCTITNTRKGKIVVVKDAVPDGPTDFKFEAGGGLSPALFFLDDDTDGTLSNTQTFSGLAPGSTYSVAGERAGWLGPDQRDVQRRQPDLGHRRQRGRDRDVHVRQHEERNHHREEGDGRWDGGLHVHRDAQWHHLDQRRDDQRQRRAWHLLLDGSRGRRLGSDQHRLRRYRQHRQPGLAEGDLQGSRRRERDVHVHEHEARRDRRQEGDDTVGGDRQLHLHGQSGWHHRRRR